MPGCQKSACTGCGISERTAETGSSDAVPVLARVACKFSALPEIRCGAAEIEFGEIRRGASDFLTLEENGIFEEECSKPFQTIDAVSRTEFFPQTRRQLLQ